MAGSVFLTVNWIVFVVTEMFFWDGFLQCFFSPSSFLYDSPLSLLLFKFSVVSIASGCFSFLDVVDDDDTGVFSIEVAVVTVVVVIFVGCFSGVCIGVCF